LEWFVYSDIPEFELPYSFRFESEYIDAESLKILNCLIKPCLLPIEVRHGREKLPISFEYYNPSIAARQFGLGQLPPKLFFADKLKPREAISSGVEFSRILQLEQSLPFEIIRAWNCQPFSSSAFTVWWQEWSQHLFNSSVASHCFTLESDFQATPEVFSLFSTRLVFKFLKQ
jgi:hypothetical protein